MYTIITYYMKFMFIQFMCIKYFIIYYVKALTFPTGRCYPKPSDKLIQKASQTITLDTAVRKQFEQDLFISKNVTDNRTSLIVQTLPKAIAADAILTKLRKEKRQPTAEEQKVIDEAETAREEIIQVSIIIFDLFIFFCISYIIFYNDLYNDRSIPFQDWVKRYTTKLPGVPARDRPMD